MTVLSISNTRPETRFIVYSRLWGVDIVVGYGQTRTASVVLNLLVERGDSDLELTARAAKLSVDCFRIE